MSIPAVMLKTDRSRGFRDGSFGRTEMAFPTEDEKQKKKILTVLLPRIGIRPARFQINNGVENDILYRYVRCEF